MFCGEQTVIVKMLPSPVIAAKPRLMQFLPGFKEYVQLVEEGRINRTITPEEASQSSEHQKRGNNSMEVIERRRVFDSLWRCGNGAEDRIVIYVAKFLGATLDNLRLTGDKLKGKLR